MAGGPHLWGRLSANTTATAAQLRLNANLLSLGDGIFLVKFKPNKVKLPICMRRSCCSGKSSV